MGTPHKATIVLVHGAWHGSWCWEPLLSLLEERGVATRAVDLPSCGSGTTLGDLHDDVEAVRDAVRASPEPVVLCGHSWGGMVVTEAAATMPRVRRLVFLCAYVPDVGDSVAALRAGRPARPWILARGATLEVDRAAGRDALYHDCDSATAEWASERLRPLNAACDGQAVSAAAWRDRPAIYALTTEDRVIEPDLQREMSRRTTEVVELPTGHSPFLARPDLVADLLVDAATRSP